MTTQKATYEVRYVGAPYGEGESGHTISRHRTREAALSALQKGQSDPHTYGSNSRVVKVVGGMIVADDQA